MTLTKKQMTANVMQSISQLSQLLFNLNNEENFFGVYGLDKAAIEGMIANTLSHVANDLPAQWNQQELIAFENFLAKEFIFFQLQERDSDPAQYKTQFSHFLKIIKRDINCRFQQKNAIGGAAKSNVS